MLLNRPQIRAALGQAFSVLGFLYQISPTCHHPEIGGLWFMAMFLLETLFTLCNRIFWGIFLDRIVFRLSMTFFYSFFFFFCNYSKSSELLWYLFLTSLIIIFIYFLSDQHWTLSQCRGDNFTQPIPDAYHCVLSGGHWAS